MRRMWRVAVIGLVVVLVATGGGLALRQYWSRPERPTTAAEATASPAKRAAEVLELSPEAQRNLGLVVKPLRLENYWRMVQMPGVIVDRPGKSDRGVTSPAVAVVAEVHAYPGDTVRPGDKLMTLKVFSEYLQNTQTELFRATRETQVNRDQIARIKSVAESGAIPAARVIELENQQRRQSAAIQAYRQDLLTRGLNAEQVEAVTEGKFVSSIEVVAPLPAEGAISPGVAAAFGGDSESGKGLAYEVQDLKAELGQQVQAGQLLCVLANHQELYIEGHAFKQEALFLERAAQNDWAIQVEFAEDDTRGWPPVTQTFQIRHLANSLDLATRTFNFYIPLTNQSRNYEKEGRTFVVWRFRPGQRVRLHVPVDEIRDAFVIPSGGVVREGPEAFVFRQNGNLFNRKPVRVLHEDRLNTVLASDGQVTPGLYITQNAAASLNRVLKAQGASGMPVGFHVHADGTIHEAH